MKRSVLALALLFALSPSAGFAAIADEATDICPAQADPCLIQQAYDVVSGSVLDFGTRTVRITAGGQIDTNTGTVTIRSGNFIVDAGLVPGIKVRGGNGFGSIDGGTLTLEARRRCELDSNRTCFSDANCSFGTCSVSVCSGDSARACASDAACDLGTCGAGNTCANDPDKSCLGDGDCKLGTCSVDVCSASRATTCSTDADCSFGTCSIGEGTIELLSAIRADGGTGGGIPGTVLLRAASDIQVGGEITARSNSVDNDGGVIDIESGQGTVTVDAIVAASGGGMATGGEVTLVGGQDVVVNQTVDVNGGDFDGGYLEIDAPRDVLVNGPLEASSTNGGGFGGEITVTAGRDVTATAPAAIAVDGHYSSLDSFGGDGGSIELGATRNLTVNSTVNVSATGAIPDGFGGEILTESGGDTLWAGIAAAKTSNSAAQGAGGNVDMTVNGALAFPVTGLMDVRGAQNGGGAIFITTGGSMTFAGAMDARTTNNGRGDGISIDVGGDVDMTGAMRVSGQSTSGVNGQIDFQFCRLTMKSGSIIENAGAYGKNFLRARERVTVQQGATITADAASGVNRLIYRDEAKPPVVNGTISPAAATDDIDPYLQGCPVCGNNELDGGETCEDGNTTNGDGCNAQCQDESCVAQTPNYPSVPVCDDADGCTQDICNSGDCQHVASCDDGIDCTTDSCSAQTNECMHVVNDAVCEDGNPCTNNICSLGQRGCVSVNNTDLCDDGLTCTEGDRCTAGVCAGTDTCVAPETCHADSNTCELGGVCGDGIVDGTEQCDDGDATWTAGQSCDAGCQSVSCGDPDDTATVRASDALFILRVAVGVSQCDPCVCNVDNSASGTAVTASDALRVLRASVGVSVELVCPAC